MKKDLHTQDIVVETYWDIVWKQFKKKKSAIISLWIIIFFFMVAIFAPLIANDKPLILYTTYHELFKTYYSDWEINHNKYTKGILKYKEIKKNLISSKKDFDKIKWSIYQLNQQNDNLGNRVDKILEEIESLESQLEKKKLNIQKNTPSSEEIIDKLMQRKLLLEKQRNTLRKDHQANKQTLLKQHAQKDNLNIKITQHNNEINITKNGQLINKSLNQLKFPVSSEIKQKLDNYIQDYEKIFEKYQKSFLNDKLIENHKKDFLNSLESIKYLIKKELSSETVTKHLVYRYTFPALSSLTLLDILFILLFLIFIFQPIIHRILKRFIHNTSIIGKIKLVLFFGILIFTIVFYLFMGTTRHISIKYKTLISKNLSESKNTNKDIQKINSKKDFIMFPPVPFGYNENFTEEKFQKPLLIKWILFDDNEKYGRHILGTDSTGRDILSRMIWGARISLSIGFVAVSIYVLIGIVVGSISGYFGGRIDMIISRIIEIVICFPVFFLILTIIAFVGPSITNIMIIIGLTSWTGIARLVRGEFLKLRDLDYIIAAKALGVSDFKIIFKHLLPNALTPVLVSATFGIASAMLIEAGLSFLGFGVREPFPSWGMMISEGQSDVLNYWWLSLIPGFAIFISVTTYNLIGDALREAIDPRLRQ